MYYQLLKGQLESKATAAIKYDADSATSFVFDPANTDYQKFKTDVAAGVPLEDPEGNVMTQEQVDDFLKTIP